MLSKFPFLNGSSRKTTLVVDNDAARLVVTNGNAVAKWAKASIPPNLIVEGTVQAPEAVAEVLEQLFRDQEVARDSVITCLSGAHALHRTLTMPQIRREDLSSAVIYQAKRELPVPTEELYTAWQVVGSDDQHLQVFLVGVPKDIVDEYMKTVNLAHLKLRSLDVKPLALARISEHPTALICNLETDSVDIVYISEYAPALVRTVYFQDTATSPAELAERLSSELYRSIRFYNDTNRMSVVSPATPLILSGSALDYYTLADALFGSVEYPIERMQPPFDYPEDFPIEEYAANLGLALKR